MWGVMDKLSRGSSSLGTMFLMRKTHIKARKICLADLSVGGCQLLHCNPLTTSAAQSCQSPSPPPPSWPTHLSSLLLLQLFQSSTIGSVCPSNPALWLDEPLWPHPSYLALTLHPSYLANVWYPRSPALCKPAPASSSLLPLLSSTSSSSIFYFCPTIPLTNPIIVLKSFS